MLNIECFVFGPGLITCCEITLIQTFFYLMIFMSAISPPSKFKFKDWPETYKTVLGSAIFIYVYICFWNLKNWSLPTKSLSIQHEGNSICFGNRFLENRVDFRWFFDRFSQIKTNFSENANFYKILNFDQVWWVTKKLLKWKGLRNV